MSVPSLLKKTFLGAGLLALVAGLILVGANWSDETLSPEAQKLLRAPTPAVPDAANGYFVLLGMDAPEGSDALQAGRAIQAGLDQEYRQNPGRATYSRAQTAGIAWDDWDKLRCPLQGADCVDHYLKNKPALVQAIGSRDLLLRRYAQLAGLADFEERPPLSVTMPLPRYQFLIRAAELRLARAVFAIEAGDVREGLAALAGEIALHRRLLESSTSLVAKMVNVAMLRRDYQVLSDAVEHWPALARTHEALLAPALRPLGPREEDMRKAFEMEGLAVANMIAFLRQPRTDQEADSALTPFGRDVIGEKEERLLLKCCFLPNATLNAGASYWTRRAEAGTGGAASADARRQGLDAYYTAWAQEQNRLPWKYIRNPAGKILLAAGGDAGSLFNYAERVHDLDGYIRLVTLQAALRRGGVAADAVPAAVAGAGPEMRNPYNGQAMRWDATSSSLLFEGRQGAQANPDAEKKTHRIKMKFA